MTDDSLILALPKGRILKEVMPLVRQAGIEPEPAFDDDDDRRLRFTTNIPGLDIIRVRAFDVATFVAFGGAQLGVAGNDVLMEFAYDDLYAPLDLGIGYCRLSLAEPDPDGPLAHVQADDDSGAPDVAGHIRVATKYPNTTRRYFAARGIQAECVKLSGAMELAPALGLSRRIVDLVSSGATLRANHLREVEEIAAVTSRLIVNRAAFKTRPERVGGWVNRFREVVADAA